MKSTKLFIVLALLGVAASFWQCGEDPAPPVDPQDAQLTKLSQTWKATNVTFNSTPVSGYETFQITMSGTAGQDTFNYTTANRPAGTISPWNTSGTFTFGTDFSTIVNRDDGTIVTYSVNDTGTLLQMTFTYTGAGYNTRINNVNGAWTFTFGL